MLRLRLRPSTAPTPTPTPAAAPSLLTYQLLTPAPTPCLSAARVQITGGADGGDGPRDLLWLDTDVRTHAHMHNKQATHARARTLSHMPPHPNIKPTQQHRLWLQRGAPSAGTGTATTIALLPPSPTLTPLGLYDSAADRVTLTCINPSTPNTKPRLLRCRLALGLRDDDSTPLAAQALRCLDAAVPPSVALPLRADVGAVLDWLLLGAGEGEDGNNGPRLTE